MFFILGRIFYLMFLFSLRAGFLHTFKYLAADLV